MSNRLPKRFKTGADMLAKMEHELSSGQRKAPAMYQVLLKCPPPYTSEDEFDQTKSGGPIKFPEDDAIKAIYKEHPNAKINSFAVNSFEAPYVRELGQAVKEFRQKGLKFGDAYEAAKQAVQQSASGAKAAPERKWLEIVQEEEEAVLQESMRELRRRAGQ